MYNLRYGEKIKAIEKQLDTGRHFMLCATESGTRVSVEISSQDAGNLILRNPFQKETSEKVEKRLFQTSGDARAICSQVYEYVLLHTQNALQKKPSKQKNASVKLSQIGAFGASH